jgi:uncharacterized protein
VRQDLFADSPIVDAHVHVFPPEFIRRRDELVETDRWFGELYRNTRASLATIEELITSMDEAHIDVSVLCGFPFSDPALCREHNAYMASCAREYPSRIAWLGTVVPSDPSAEDLARQALEYGACGIGELNADGQGFDLVEPEMLASLVRVCEVHERPIMFHVSEPVGHSYPGKGTATPNKLIRFLEAYPDVSIVAAHWGGGLPFYELMPEVATATRNVVYDSAATTYLYRFPVFRSVIDLVGARRVLFASDYPVLRQDRLRLRVERLALPHDSWKLIMGENAVRFYRLEETISQVPRR